MTATQQGSKNTAAAASPEQPRARWACPAVTRSTNAWGQRNARCRAASTRLSWFPTIRLIDGLKASATVVRAIDVTESTSTETNPMIASEPIASG